MSYINYPNNNIPMNKSINPSTSINNSQIKNNPFNNNPFNNNPFNNNNFNNNPFNNNNFNNSNIPNNSNVMNHLNFNSNISNNIRSSLNNNNYSKINKNNFDYNKSYKKEKDKELLNNQKHIRFNQNYENKIKDNANNNNNINSNNNEEVFLSDYIEKIKQIYQDRTEYDSFISDKGYYNFSHCPFCHKPSIFYIDRVQCIDNCFKTALPSDTFSPNYTLDNFIEQYEEYYTKHLDCHADLITLYIDNESKTAEFLCSKCERNIFDDD